MQKRNAVGIIAGHGGKDRGTGAGGFDEAAYSLEYTQLLAASARALWPTQPIALLRATDESLGLYAAAERADELGCGLAIIVHINAGPPALTGGTAYHWPGDALGRSVADACLAAYPRVLHCARQSFPAVAGYGGDHAWQQRPSHILKHYARRGVSAALLQLFYASRPRDVRLACSRWVRETLVLAGLAGIADWHRQTGDETICVGRPL